MANSEQTSLNEIVVTAERRAEPLQDTPVAVTALSAQALEQLNVQTTQNLMQVVPGLQVSTQAAADGGGSATFFLRGMGQEYSGNGTEPAVGIYVDDFYYPSLYGSIFDIVDIADIEVLRGPQGTLFGRNTIGGAIRYTSLKPDLSDFSARVTGTAGNFDRRDGSAVLNVPLGEVAALRLTGGLLEREGFVRIQTTDKDAGGSKTTLARLQFLFEPNSSFRADLSAQYSRFDLDGYTYDVPGPLTPQPPAPGTQPTLPFIWNAAVAPALRLPLYTNALRSACFYCQPGTGSPEYSRTIYKNALATLSWDFAAGFSLKSLTGYQNIRNQFTYDLDSTVLPIFGGALTHNYTNALSQELQLNGTAFNDRLNGVSGLYYYTERLNRGNDTPTIILGRPVPPTLDQRNLQSYAAYLDASFKLIGELKLLGGFRYSTDHKTVVTTDSSGNVLSTGSATFPSTTYRGGLQYDWTHDFMTYINVATGFRGGGFNAYTAGLDPPLQPFGPEKDTSYELGMRLQLLDRRITLNPTLFYVDWTRIQVQSVQLNVTNGDAEIIIHNAGKARSYGAELESSANVTDGLRLFGNVAYLDMHYTDIGDATGITLNSQFEHAPRFTFTVGATHTLSLASGGTIASTLDYNYQGAQTSVPTDAQTLQLRPYGVLNTLIRFTSANQRYDVDLFATNLLNKKYAIGGVNYYAGFGAARYDLGQPREYGLTVRLKL